MKAKKERLGTKARIRALKKRERRVVPTVFLALILLIIVVSAYFTYSSISQSSNQTINQAYQFRATIVDHLSLSRPNQTFIETATNTLKQAGYSVDYYPGEQVTVEFYRNLPTHGYEFMILRVHSTAANPEMVTLFTSERYEKTKYIYEQLRGDIVSVAFSQDEADKGILYFGVNPLFVTQSMKGRFQNTKIIMTGCDGLSNTKMAEAFIEKGARVYIGWNGSILGTRNDPAIAGLLQHLVTENQTVEKAVADTMKEFAPSSIDNSVLQYYPLEARDQTIN